MRNKCMQHSIEHWQLFPQLLLFYSMVWPFNKHTLFSQFQSEECVGFDFSFNTRVKCFLHFEEDDFNGNRITGVDGSSQFKKIPCGMYYHWSTIRNLMSVLLGYIIETCYKNSIGTGYLNFECIIFEIYPSIQKILF